MANALSRPQRMIESGPAGTLLADWSFLGLEVLTGIWYESEAEFGMTMINGGTGDAGDAYTGLDRFGRLVETIWKNSVPAKLVHSTYGRNRLGGVNWRRDNLAHAMSVTDQDNYYWYDGLQQVTQHDRGNLVPTTGSPYVGIATPRAQQELFNYDQTGNWNAYHDQVPGLNQTRTQNAANEISSIAGPAGVVQPAYDPAGNMTACPKPGDWDTQYDLKWDAWNRLVQIKQGETFIATNAYDALTRRTKQIAAGETTNYYYNDQWRSIEERVAGIVKTQYAWTPWDRWSMIRRQNFVDGALDDTLYVAKDYLDPVAVIAPDSTVVERYGYEAFGPVRMMDAAFAVRTASVCGWSFLFHGEFLDMWSGFYNYGYRFYHPGLGRWTSRDAFELIEIIANQKDAHRGVLGYLMAELSLNYLYLDNNPINDTDLYGEIGIDTIVTFLAKCLGKAVGKKASGGKQGLNQGYTYLGEDVVTKPGRCVDECDHKLCYWTTDDLSGDYAVEVKCDEDCRSKGVPNDDCSNWSQERGPNRKNKDL